MHLHVDYTVASDGPAAHKRENLVGDSFGFTKLSSTAQDVLRSMRHCKVGPTDSLCVYTCIKVALSPDRHFSNASWF